MSKLDDLRKSSEDVSRKIDEAIKPKEQPAPNADTHFTYADKKKMTDRTLLRYKDKKINIKHREKKMIEDMEYDSTRSIQGIVVGLAVVGLVFIMLVRNMLPTEAAFIVIVLIGSMMFLPVGMIIGWI